MSRLATRLQTSALSTRYVSALFTHTITRQLTLEAQAFCLRLKEALALCVHCPDAIPTDVSMACTLCQTARRIAS